jgi:hypothetical protein
VTQGRSGFVRGIPAAARVEAGTIWAPVEVMAIEKVEKPSADWP